MTVGWFGTITADPRQKFAGLTIGRGETSSALVQIEALRHVLSHTRNQLEDERRKVVSLEKALAGCALYAPVGLRPDCADFIVKAVRTAYRREYHPDTKASEQKVEAEARFKQVEAVFDRITAARA